MKQAFYFLFILISSYQTAFCQLEIVPDTLIEKYLSSTNDAARKIKELNQKAFDQKSSGNKLDAIRTFQIALSLVPYAGDSFEVISKLHSDFAALLHYSKAEDLSIKYAKSALEYQRKADPKASSRGYNLIGGIAGHYLRTEQFDSALYYYHLQLIEAYNTHISLWIAGAYNNTGILFFKKGDLHSAHFYFDSAYLSLIIRDHGDSSLRASIADNLAQLALKEKNYSKAKDLYQSNLSFYINWNDSIGMIKSLEGMATVLLAEQKYGELQNTFQAIRRFPQINSGKYGINFTLSWFSLQNEYYSATGNWKPLSETQKQLAFFKDSLNAVFTKEQNELMHSITASEVYRINTDLSIFQFQLKQREKDLSIAHKGLFAAALLVLLSISILILLFTNYRSKARIQNQEIQMQTVAKQLAEVNLRNQQMEQERIKRELDFKKKDLSDLALYVTKLKDMYELMAVKLNQIKRKRNADHKQELSNLTTEIDALVQSQEKLTLIQENVGQINKEFLDVLMQKFPTLTKSEIELCGFFRLNMSNKEIGALKGISAESVKMSRYRLRKKLGLSQEDDIYRFISSI